MAKGELLYSAWIVSGGLLLSTTQTLAGVHLALAMIIVPTILFMAKSVIDNKVENETAKQILAKLGIGPKE